MNPPVLNNRRIERYAQLLDEASGGRRHHARSPIDDELANMLAASGALANVATELAPDATPSESYRLEGRALLMAQAERLGVGRTYREDPGDLVVSRPAVGRASVGTVHESASRRGLPGRRPKTRLSPNRSRTRGAILIGLAVGTLALSGISAASGDAMPGSPLYGMKRSAENAQISLAGSDSSKGKLYLEFAQTRANEALQISSNASLLDGVLGTMADETTAGEQLLFRDAIAHRSSSDLAAVDSFVTYQSKQLASLQTVVSGTESAKVVAAINNLYMIHARSAEIAGLLSCPATIKLSGSDDLGQIGSCQVGASAAITAPTRDTVGATGGAATGTASGSAAKTIERTAPATPKIATTTAVTTDVTAAPTVVVPSAAPSYDGGLLGSVEHLLGGL